MNGIIYGTQQVTSSAGLKTSTTALASNPARIKWIIQNQDTAKLFLKFGAGCSGSDYDLVLKASSSAADGTGGSYNEASGTIFTGVVSVFSAGTPSYTVSENQP